MAYQGGEERKESRFLFVISFSILNGLLAVIEIFFDNKLHEKFVPKESRAGASQSGASD